MYAYLRLRRATSDRNFEIDCHLSASGIAANCNQNMSAQCTSSTVTLTWNAITGPEVPGPFTYHILRNGTTELPQCIGSATTCTDTPGSGVYGYRAYSVDQNGVPSPRSAAATVSEP
jgi:hypothetical protein